MTAIVCICDCRGEDGEALTHEYLLAGKAVCRHCDGELVCIDLDAKDAEIAALKARQLWVDSLIAALVVPHELLDDGATPGEQYDDLMASWALALTGLRAYYHDHIIAAQRREGEDHA